MRSRRVDEADGRSTKGSIFLCAARSPGCSVNSFSVPPSLFAVSASACGGAYRTGLHEVGGSVWADAISIPLRKLWEGLRARAL